MSNLRGSPFMRMWRARKRVVTGTISRVDDPKVKRRYPPLRQKFVFVPPPQKVTILGDGMVRSVEKQAVEQGLDFKWIDGNKLPSGPYHYNSGLIDIDGRLWMAYRRQRTNQDSDIGIVQLNQHTLEPIATSAKLLKLPERVGPTEQFEDPRLFWYGGRPWIAYVSWRKYSHSASINICELDRSLKPVRDVRIEYGGNWRQYVIQKNWIFFEHNGQLLFVYHSSPHEIVSVDFTGSGKSGEPLVSTTEMVARESGVQWEYGPVRGGTPPILYNGRYYSFFHSRLLSSTGRNRYYMGAYVFSSIAPFRPISVTKTPILAASEEDLNIETLPLVVFPCGAVKREAEWLVSLGVNDVSTAIVRIRHDQLLQMLGELTLVPENRVQLP